MLCVYCNTPTKIIDSAKYDKKTYRKRKCPKCDAINYTVETECAYIEGRYMVNKRYNKYVYSEGLL